MKEEFIENKEALIYLKSIFGEDLVTKVEIKKDETGYVEIDDCYLELTSMDLFITFSNGNVVVISTSEFGWIQKYEKTNN